MSKQIQLRRGTTTQHSTFTGAEGECTVDTTKDTVVVHDGSTAGGHPLSKEPSSQTLSGYTIASSAALPASSDTINQAIGKLSKTASDTTSQLADNTEKMNTLIIENDPIVLVDNIGASDTGTYISAAARRFEKLTFPRGATITTIQFRAKLNVGTTVTVEFWKYDMFTDNIVMDYNVILSGTLAGINTVPISYVTSGITYISIKNTSPAICYTVADGTLFSTDLTSTTLLLSAIPSTTSVKLCLYAEYRIDDNALSIAKSVKNTIYTVGVYGDYQTISEAINETDAGDTIVIYPGTYREQVSAFGKERHIVGVCKNTCILIDSSSDYRTPPIEMNLGSIRNMTIIEDALEPAEGLDLVDLGGFPAKDMAYCIHADSSIGLSTAVDKRLTVENCTFINANRPCIGAGLYQDYEIIIKDCDGVSGIAANEFARGALYYHNNVDNSITGQKISIINSRFKCEDTFVVKNMRIATTGCEFEVEYINNMFWSTTAGITNIIDGSFDADFTLAGNSYGNNVPILNA